MNAKTFKKDFEYYESKLINTLEDETIVNLMMHAYCMAYCDHANNLYDKINLPLDPVLDKIKELSPKIAPYFATKDC